MRMFEGQLDSAFWIISIVRIMPMRAEIGYQIYPSQRKNAHCDNFEMSIDTARSPKSIAESRRMWARLEDDTLTGPIGPEEGFPAEVIAYAMYGREYIRRALGQSTTRARALYRGIRRAHHHGGGGNRSTRGVRCCGLPVYGQTPKNTRAVEDNMEICGRGENRSVLRMGGCIRITHK